MFKSPKKVLNKTSIFLFFLLITCNLHAQQGPSIELKPIHHQGFYYYYDFKKIDGGAYGLQIPLLSLNDEEINRRYKTFKTYRGFQLALSLVPFVYLFALVADQTPVTSTSGIWQVYFISLGTAILLEIPAKHHLNKGIERYNKLILQPAVGRNGVGLILRF